jgi:hypothetical protein
MISVAYGEAVCPTFSADHQTYPINCYVFNGDMLDETGYLIILSPLDPQINTQPFRPTYRIGSMLFLDEIIFRQVF